MDIRISFRVRERKDVDLILGQGMLAAGWHAHTLNAPGKFLIAAAEHDTPKRAGAYLLTDQTVEAAANYYADYRPPLDAVSQQAIEDQDPYSERAVVHPDPTPRPPTVGETVQTPCCGLLCCSPRKMGPPSPI
jgi:hypothetical protein